MSKFYPFGSQTFFLGSSISSTGTSILLSSFTEPVTGIPYTMVLLNTDIVYGTIAPRTMSSEFISFTGITQNANGTALLTGVTRGLAKKYPFTEDGIYKLPHSGQSQFIISDAPQVFVEYPAKENDENITGLWNFTQTPTGLNPGAVQDASTTVKGIGKVSVPPVSSTNPIFVGDNDTRVPTQGENDALVGDNTDIAVGTGNKFVTQTGLQKSVETYASSATGNDSYAITLSPVPISYINGMTVRFKADVGNTGAATLNVNSLGTITIKKLGNQDLGNGDIIANQIITVTYNSTGTIFELQSPPSNPVTPQVVSTFTAGQTLSAGQPVCVLPYPVAQILFDNKGSNSSTGTTVSYTFTVAANSNRGLIVVTNTPSTTPTGVTYNSVSMTKVSSTTASSIHTDVWYLAAPATGANTVAITSSGSQTVTSVVYSYYNVSQSGQPEVHNEAGTSGGGPINTSATPLTNGALVFGVSYNQSGSSSGSVYTNNTMITNTVLYSGDSGAIYPPSSQTMTSGSGGANYSNNVIIIAPVAAAATARVYLTSGVQTTTVSSFIGIAQGAAVAGASVSVLVNGLDQNQTSLTIGSQYYLADSPGTIATSAGTVSRKAAIATSPTSLVITNIW